MAPPKGHPAYNINGEGGRPKIWTDEAIEKEAEAFLVWLSLPDSIWYEDFALERGYCPDYISEWADSNDRFRRVYKYAKGWQKSKLTKGGLLNTFNPPFTKFVMSNTCGWTDKSETKSEISGLQDLFKDISDTSRDLVNNE